MSSFRWVFRMVISLPIINFQADRDVRENSFLRLEWQDIIRIMT